MINLPKNTEFNKRIPKTKFYENLSASTALKRVFVEQINSIFWANKIATSTTNFKAGENVIEIEVFRIKLNQKEFDENALRKINKSIPYHNVFILEFENECKMVICLKNLIQTQWLPIENASIQLKGLNLDDVWENIVCQVGDIKIEQGNTLEQQISADEYKQKLEKEIARLEKQARAEKQPKKTFELVQEIRKLKKEWNDD